jgi:hypothetical protein
VLLEREREEKRLTMVDTKRVVSVWEKIDLINIFIRPFVAGSRANWANY